MNKCFVEQFEIKQYVIRYLPRSGRECYFALVGNNFTQMQDRRDLLSECI